jgi:hypothetical protein
MPQTKEPGEGPIFDATDKSSSYSTVYGDPESLKADE